jgi:hypothetical protein
MKKNAKGKQFQSVHARSQTYSSRFRFDQTSGSGSHRPDAAV